jgi:hypothetical protein
MDIREDIAKSAKEAAYVTVGLGVMAFQKAQVRRRELVELAKQNLPAIESPLHGARAELGKVVKEIDGRIEALATRFHSQVEPLEHRLPAQAQAVVGQAWEARAQLRNRFLSALAA